LDRISPALRVKSKSGDVSYNRRDRDRQRIDFPETKKYAPEEIALEKKKILACYHLRKEMRENIEKGRTLCSLVIKRERLKAAELENKRVDIEKMLENS